MFSSKKSFFILMAALIAVNAGVLVYLVLQTRTYRDHKPPQHRECPAFETRMSAALKLTPQQSEQFREIRQNHILRMKPVRDSIRQIRKFMGDELISEQPDVARLDSVADVLGLWHAKVRKMYIAHFFEFKALCNPEQQKILGKIYMDVICCDEPHGDRKCKPGKKSCGHKDKPHKACVK